MVSWFRTLGVKLLWSASDFRFVQGIRVWYTTTHRQTVNFSVNNFLILSITIFCLYHNKVSV